MKRFILLFLLIFTAVAAFSGCSMRTVDQMYSPPKRSEQYDDLQSAIDTALAGKEYCAPISGENQQTIQQADIDGDGTAEYLLFAKTNSEKPLNILIFKQINNEFQLIQTIESGGTAFDRVEYVQMDGIGGVEIIVGKQVSDQVQRSASVYTFAEGEAKLLVSANYSHFLTVDLDCDSASELFVLHPGDGEQDNGVAVLYDMSNGYVERSNEVKLSRPIDMLKRTITGKLHGGLSAVFVASAVDESTIITDVYALVEGLFVNIALSNEGGTGIQTMRNYYVYADDIDDDGEVELPFVDTVGEPSQQSPQDKHHMIRWYALRPDGSEVDKMYTFHNFSAGWYLQLDANWADRITVSRDKEAFDFYLQKADGDASEKVFTVYAFTGKDRETLAVSDNRFVLYKGESAVYSAYLEVASAAIDITKDDLINGFRPIRQDWKTGET